MPNDDMLSVADAADILGVHVRTIHRLIARGELAAARAYVGLRAPYVLSRKQVERRRPAQSQTVA